MTTDIFESYDATNEYPRVIVNSSKIWFNNGMSVMGGGFGAYLIQESSDVFKIYQFAGAEDTYILLTTDTYQMVQIKGNLIPSVNNTYDLGIVDLGFRWRNAYLSGSITLAGREFTGAQATDLTDGGDCTSHIHTAYDSLGKVTKMTASANLKASNDEVGSSANLNFTKVNEVMVLSYGTATIKFDMASAVNGTAVHGQIWCNGVALGTNQSTMSLSYTTYSQNLRTDLYYGFKPGDLIQLYVKAAGACNVIYRNFRLYWDNSLVSNFVGNNFS